VLHATWGTTPAAAAAAAAAATSGAAATAAAAKRDVISRNVNTTTTTKYPYPQQATSIAARPTGPFPPTPFYALEKKLSKSVCL